MTLHHTHCGNCNCSLSRNSRAIEEHLKYSHGILIKLNYTETSTSTATKKDDMARPNER